MGWILPLLLMLPQGLPQQVPGVVVRGQLHQGRLPLQALGLGDGGVVEPSIPARALRRGRHLSPGGVTVEARREGVKLSFPSGIEVLFTPSGFLHLRSGEQKGSFPQGIELLLGDGSSVCVWLGGRRPMRRVEVRQGDRAVLLWHRDVPRREVVRPQPSTSPQLVVLGDGDAIYRALPWGPLIVMERMLCTETQQPSMPERYLVVVADGLIQSLSQLRKKFLRRAVEFPEATEISSSLSREAAVVFGANGSSLRRVTSGFLRLGMDSGFELSLHVPDVGPLLLSLHRGQDARTLVEWMIGNSTELRMVRPHGGSAIEPRYFRSGLDLPQGLEQLTSLRSGYPEQEEGRRILRAMGGVPLRSGVAAKPGG